MAHRFLLLFLFISSSAISQEQLIADAINEYTTARLWSYEEIPMKWTMEGNQQADLNEGINFLIENRPTLAEENLSRALEKNSKLWPAFYYRGVAKKMQRKFMEAQFDIQAAIKLNPSLYEGYVELAKIQFLILQIQESERSIKKAIALEPDRPTAYYIRGDINLAQMQRQKAREDYEFCLKVKPDYHDAKVKLALLESMSKKNDDEVIKQLDQVLKLDSLNKGALLIHALLYYEKDKLIADRDLTYLIQADPNALLPYVLRGTLLTELKDFSRAFSDFQKLAKATEADENAFRGSQTNIDKKIDIQNAGAYLLTRLYGLSEEDREAVKEGYCYLFIGDYETALSSFRSLDSSEEPLVTYLRAITFEHMGKHQQAYEWYSRTRKLDNDIPDVHKKLGIYQQELQQWPLSIKSFNKVLELTPDALIVFKARGVSYYNLEQYEESINDFSRYIVKGSSDQEVYGYRGMAYLKTGKKLEAYVDFSVSGNENMIDFPDFIRLIDDLIEKGDTVEVVAKLERVVYPFPKLTEGFTRLIKIKVKQGDWKFIEENISQATSNMDKNTPNIDASYLLTIEAMVRMKDNNEASFELFTKAIRLDDNNSLAYLQRGKLLLEQGKRTKAELDIRKASMLGNEEARQLLKSSFY